MIINTNSWHYRFLNWMDQIPKTNLCPYVRQVILYMGVFGFLATMGTFLVLASLYIAGQILGWLVAMLVTLSWIVPDPATAVATLLILAVLLALGTTYLARRVRRWVFVHSHEWVNDEYVPRPPNVFVAWIKAKHDKICPAIQFKEAP